MNVRQMPVPSMITSTPDQKSEKRVNWAQRVIRWAKRFFFGWMFGRSHVSQETWKRYIDQLKSDSTWTVWVKFRDDRQPFTASAFISGDDDGMMVQSCGKAFWIQREEIAELKLLRNAEKAVERVVNRIQRTGIGRITGWRFKTASMGFGYLSDKETNESFFFETRGIIDDTLKISLAQGKYGQIVRYSIIKDKVGGKLATVQILEMLKDFIVSDPRYKLGHKAMISGDLDKAEDLLRQVAEDPSAVSRLSALKDLAETYNRQGKITEAYDTIERYRKEFPAEEWGSFERMQIGYLERRADFKGALQKVETLLKQSLNMSEGQRSHYEHKRDILRMRIASPINEGSASDEIKPAEMEIVNALRQKGLNDIVVNQLHNIVDVSNQHDKIVLSQLDDFRRSVGWPVRKRIYQTIRDEIDATSFPPEMATAIMDAIDGELERQAEQVPGLEFLVPKHPLIIEGENTIEFGIRLSRQSDVPLRDIQIFVVKEAHGADGQADASCPELSYDDGEKKLPITIVVSPREMQNKRGSIQYEIRYQKDLGDEILSRMDENAKSGIVTGRIDFPIGDNEFTPISPNPFELYCNHAAEDAFFVGRSELLNDMVDCLSDKSGGQAYVLYGQAKTGKTSVRKNLKGRLTAKMGESVLYTELTIKDWGRGEAGRNMKREPLKWVAFDLEMSAIEDALRPLGKWTSNDEATLSKFPKDYYAGRIKFLGQCLRNNGIVWIVSIDEFSELYDFLQEVAENREVRDNMASLIDVLKGRLEGGSFNLLLVGLGSMGNFISEFRNDFHVLKKERLTYLDSSSAIKLLTTPIAGRLRIEKEAAERYCSLTGGFPLYAMYFCRDIVEFANANQYCTITLEDMEEISDVMCEGVGKWSPDEFDPFFQFGIRNYDGRPLDENNLVELYYKVAGDGNDDTSCPIDVFNRQEYMDWLNLLCDYGVLVRNPNGTVSFSVGIFAKYLQKNKGLSYSDFKKVV